MPIATPEVYAAMLDAAKEKAFAYPGHQRVVVADPERRPPGVRRRRLRRDHPGLHRRRGVPLRPVRQEHGDRLGRVRRVRRRGRQELPRQHRAAHRPLPQGQARRLRPAAARHLRRAGGPRRGPAVPVAHVGRLRRTPRREPADRRGAAGQGCAAAKIVLEVEIGVVGGEEDGVANEINEQALHHPRGRARDRRRRSAPARTAAT